MNGGERSAVGPAPQPSGIRTARRCSLAGPAASASEGLAFMPTDNLATAPSVPLAFPAAAVASSAPPPPSEPFLGPPPAADVEEELELVFQPEANEQGETSAAGTPRRDPLEKHAEWLDQQTTASIARFEARQAAERSPSTSEPLARVLARANFALRQNRYPPPSIAADQVGPLAHAQAVLDLLNALTPLRPLPAEHPALMLVVGPDPLEEDRMAPDGESLVQEYIREIEWPDTSAFFGFLNDVEYLLPAEIPRWRTIRHVLTSQLEAGRDPAEPVALFYGGMTIASTPIGRAESDSKATTAQTCMGQVLALMRQQTPSISANTSCARLRVYELPALRQDATDPIMDANRVSVANVEIVLVQLLPLALNSARGGRLIHLDDLPELRHIVKRAGASWADVEELAPSSEPPALERNCVRDHLADELAFLRGCSHAEVGVVPDLSEDAGRAAFTDISNDATAGSTRLNGHFSEVLVSKDVTLADLAGRESFAGDRPARGPALRKELEGYILGFALESLRVVYACVDFWGLCLRHILVNIMILFLYRYLRIKEPTLIVTRSSKVSFLFRAGAFRS